MPLRHLLTVSVRMVVIGDHYGSCRIIGLVIVKIENPGRKRNGINRNMPSKEASFSAKPCDPRCNTSPSSHGTPGVPAVPNQLQI